MEQQVRISRSRAKRQVDRIRIWVVANPLLVLDCLGFFIKKYKQFDLAGASQIDHGLPAFSRKPEADIVVVYLEPGDPVEIIDTLHTKFPKVKIIVITDGTDVDCSMKALNFGAVGIIQAKDGSNSLIEAIKKAHNGETWLNQDLLTNLLEKGAPKSGNGKIGPANDSLTPREMEVIAMIGKGFKSKVIAEHLSISQATVRHHLSSIYGKLGVDDRLNLMIYAVETGLVKFD